MQRPIAVISDVHANLEALKAVLNDADERGVQSFFCLGDIVGYASGVNACVRKIRELGCPSLLGNHDEAASIAVVPEEFNDTAAAGALYAASQLTTTNKYWLQSLPRHLEHGNTSFVHASLGDLDAWPYILSEKDAFYHFAHQKTEIGFCGHTHKPMIWTQDSVGRVTGMKPGIDEPLAIPAAPKVLFNVGSVGQPRDGDARACYVIYDPKHGSVEFRRIPYDFKITKRKILRASLPRFSGQRLALGR